MKAKLGRPKLPEDELRIIVNFRMKRIDVSLLNCMAKSLGLTKSKFITKCLEDKLFNL
jgi:hypothetical protein